MDYISVKRIDPVPGNSFTPNWSNTTNCAMTTMDKCPTRPSTVAEFNIELKFEEITALLNGHLNILDNMLKKRLGIDLLERYDIVSVKTKEV